MPRHGRRIGYNSSEDFLMHFFVQTLLLVLEMPDSLIDELEEALKLSSEQKREMQERLRKLKAIPDEK